MGFFARLRDAFRQTKAVSGVELMQQTGNNYFSWRGSVYQSDIVRACIRPKVKAVGKLVAKHLMDVYDSEGKKTDVRTNPRPNIRFLLEEPNPVMTGQELQEKMAAQLILNSNAFALIMRDDFGNPASIWPIAPVNAEAVYSNSGALSIRFTMSNNKIFVFPYEDIIHLRQDYDENDIFGTPVASALVPLLNVVSTTDQGVVNAIRNSSIIRWLLKFQTAMRPEDLKARAAEFSQNYLQSTSGTGVAATDSKADAQQITPTDYVPNAAQMNLTTRRIMNLFNVSQAIIESNYTEDQYGAFFDSEVEPVSIAMAKEFTRKLFTRRERAFGNRIVFEAGAWDSASTKTKLALVAMVDRGAMTPNEWRATMNLAPIEGGDVPIRRLDTQQVTDEGGDTE